MAPKPLNFTLHAQDAIEEREIDPVWIERAVREPEWTVPDSRRPGVERCYRSVPEFGNRVLRVACFETDVEIRILTVFFDRDARPPQ